jgi:NAD(P)-dependent dehydrogenase (short-subunit alcohol dehydrogenase family)
MTMVMANRTVFVTGGGRGIGRAIALGFAEPGAHIVITSRTSEELEKTAADIRAKGAEATAITMDVTDEVNVAQRFGSLHGLVKQVNVLVNNAGIGGGEVVQASTPT